MDKRTFGRTGFQVSPLGFGSAPVGYLQVERDRAGQVMNRLLDAGVNLIDTAASYPGAEELIADTIGHRRAEFVLVSKCGGGLPDVSAPEWSAENITQTVERSLRRLRMDVIDIMLLHSCDLKTLQKGEALGALVKARDAGKVRFAGYSGDNDAAAYAAGLPDIAAIETSISLADQINLDKVLPIARKNNLGVLSKRPIANAAWRQTSEQQGLYQNYAKVYSDRLAKMNLNPGDFGFTAQRDEAWSELALRFTLSHPGVHCAIIGTTSLANAEKNIIAVEKGLLTSETVQAIRDAFRRADPACTWKGET